MAKQKNNMVMHNTRGMVGKQIVFKKRAGKTYVAAPPEVNENRKPTPKQLLVQEMLKKSASYAEKAIKSDELKKQYQTAAKRGQSANNVAFLDAYNAPKVLSILAQGYQGQAGNHIVIAAKDDFKVIEVKVSIVSSANELIEQGAATPNADGLNWSYMTTQPNANVTGSKITATAVDLPGNEGSLEVTL